MFVSSRLLVSCLPACLPATDNGSDCDKPRASVVQSLPGLTSCSSSSTWLPPPLPLAIVFIQTLFIRSRRHHHHSQADRQTRNANRQANSILSSRSGSSCPLSLAFSKQAVIKRHELRWLSYFNTPQRGCLHCSLLAWSSLDWSSLSLTLFCSALPPSHCLSLPLPRTDITEGRPRELDKHIITANKKNIGQTFVCLAF